MSDDQLSTENYQLPEGYQQTEVGVIPEDWKLVLVGELEPFVTSGSRGWARYYSKYGAPFIRITNLRRESIYLDLSDLKLVDLPEGVSEGKRTKLHNGDLLISITADIGIIGYVNDSVPKPAYINQHISLVRFDPEKSDSKFIAYFLAFESVQRLFRGATDQGAKAGLNLDTIRSLKFAFPPSYEQRSIAQALSDVDRLIAALEKAIAKKRAIKTATMQQLLTGKKRLPGFGEGKGHKKSEIGVIPEDWDTRPLSELMDKLEAGISVNSVEEANKEYGHEQSVLKTSSVFGGEFFPNECKKIISKDIHRAKLNPQKDTIVISRMNTPALVGECGYVGEDYKNLFLPDRLWLTRFKKDSLIDVRWLAYILSYGTFNKAIKDTATGTSSSMKNIAKDSFLQITIPYPHKEEQRAIATVLSDMDRAIAALETRLAKTQALKQGMMQALLTGRVRLKIEI